MSLWLNLLTLLLWHHARCAIRLDVHELCRLVLLGRLYVGIGHLLHHQLCLGRMVLVHDVTGHSVVLALGPAINRCPRVLKLHHVLA